MKERDPFVWQKMHFFPFEIPGQPYFSESVTLVSIMDAKGVENGYVPISFRILSII